jgi:type IV pilus assembly protein PilE
MKSQKGFTLTELMVVVAIVGILSAIILPQYKDYVLRGKIPDATTSLASRRVQMEQYFQDNRTYTGADGAGQPCANDSTTSQYFNFSCTVAAASYTILATGKDTMAGFAYNINESNVKTTVAVTGDGWSLPTPNNCWVTKGGSC